MCVRCIVRKLTRANSRRTTNKIQATKIDKKKCIKKTGEENEKRRAMRPSVSCVVAVGGNWRGCKWRKKVRIVADAVRAAASREEVGKKGVCLNWIIKSLMQRTSAFYVGSTMPSFVHGHCADIYKTYDQRHHRCYMNVLIIKVNLLREVIN